MNTSESHKPLSETLAVWQVTPKRDPKFRSEVWRRVSARARVSAWPGYFRAHAFAATGFLLLALALGAWSGHAKARTQAETQRERMIAAYVESLDARAMIAQR